MKALQLAVLFALGLSASAQTAPLTFTISPAVFYSSATDQLALEHQTYAAIMSDGLAGQLRAGYPETQFLWIDEATGRQFVEYANGTQVWGAPPQTLPNGNLLYTMTSTGSPDQNSGQPNARAIQRADRDSAARSDLRAALSLAHSDTRLECGWRLWFADPAHPMSCTEVQIETP